MDCGATCIRIVAQFYGHRYSSDTLNEICQATREGVSLSIMVNAAEYLGFRTSCGQTTINKLIKQRPFPCILHWNQNHFVVLYDIKKTIKGNLKFYISDPGKGLIKLEEETFKNHWFSTQINGEDRGIVMALQPTSAFYKREKDLDMPRSSYLDFIWKYVQPYKKYFIQILIGLLVASLLQLAFPFLTQAIVDVGIKNQSISIIYLILLGQFMLILSRTSVDFIRRWLLLHISTRFNLSILSDFFIKLMRLPMSFFDTKMTGDILQRIDDHARVERLVTAQSLNVLFSAFSFIVFAIVLFYYSVKIFIVYLIGSLLYTLWILRFLEKRKELDYRYFEQYAKKQNKTIQIINGMQEIKLQNCERRYRWEWEDVQADLFYTNIENLKLQQVQEAGRILINETKNICITILAATSVIVGDLTLGVMLAIQYIIGQLNTPIEQLVQFTYSWQDAKISFDRLFSIHQQEDEDNVKRNSKIISSNTIRISDLTFRYEGLSSPKVLNNIQLHIPKGQITAIVGSSGSGKTTLLKLLLGYYKIQEGDIKIGDISLSNFNLEWWRNKCGAVMQDGYLFSDSIANNIATGQDEINVDKLMYAAKIANIDDFISQLPLGINTIIGKDGLGLSQGQRQRILIARVVYRNPDFLFFDEATNSLDANNEKVITNNLENFYKGKTVVIVAHRLSTVKNANQIIVLEKGTIIEIGNHQTLIQNKGAYYNLVKNQLELGN